MIAGLPLREEKERERKPLQQWQTPSQFWSETRGCCTTQQPLIPVHEEVLLRIGL